METVAKWIVCGVLLIGGMFLLGLLQALFVMWLWNYLTPEVLPLSDMNFPQALALTILCNFLFKTTNRISAKKDE